MYTLKTTEMFAEAVRKDPWSLRFVSIVVVIIITIIIVIIIIISLFKVDTMKLFT